MMEANKSEDEVDDSHCCCKSATAIKYYTGVLLILGILMIVNICFVFNNKFFPTYYPCVSLVLVLLFIGGLVLIAVWMCS
jgi:hypothetical protein